MLKRVVRWTAIVVGGFVGACAIWSAMASYIWSLMTKEPNGFPWVTSWWIGTHWFGANWWCNVCLVVSAGFATFVTLGASFGIINWAISASRRNPNQTVYGQTDWADRKEMSQGGISTKQRPI